MRAELRVQVAMKSQCSDAMHWLMEECREMVDEVKKAAKDVPWDYDKDYKLYVVVTSSNSFVLRYIFPQGPWFWRSE